MGGEKLCIVEFTHPTSGYNSGDHAGVKPDYATALIKSGRARISHKSGVTEAELMGPSEDTDEPGEVLDNRTHELSNDQVIELVEGIDDLKELGRLWDGEQANPKGARKGALKAIRQRATEVKEELDEAEGTD